MKSPLSLLSLAATLSLVLPACQNGQKSSSGSSGDPYVANYGSDGAYNPYPGQSGYVQSGGSGPEAPTYTQAPPPMGADPYAFKSTSGSSSGSSSSTPKKTTTSSSSGTKKTVASSSTKPKSTTAKKSTSSTRKSGSHKVVSGDSLYAIARRNNTTVVKLKAANNLTTDLIRPGQVLKIP